MRRHLLPAILVPILLIAGSAHVLCAPLPGDHIPAFSLSSIDGKLQTWKPGRITVMTFCAFWCDTWKDQSKRLTEVSKSCNGLPVDFLTISIDGRWSELGKDKFVGKIMLDPGRKLSDKFEINRIPYTLIVNSEGTVFYAVQGIIRSKDITKQVTDCLSSAPTAQIKTVYLTFDDFPCPPQGPSTTPSSDLDGRLLAILRKEHVPATFFCVCSRLKPMRSLIETALKDGHSLQVHSWDHNANEPRLNDCVREMQSLTGLKPTLYRAPGSDKCQFINGKQLTNPVVNPYDYHRPGTAELKRRILLAVKPNSVILLHVGVSETIEVLPSVISSLKARGYQFRLLSDQNPAASGNSRKFLPSL